MPFTGTKGTIAIQTATGEWRELGPGVLTAEPAVTADVEPVAAASATFTVPVKLSWRAWNRMCRVLKAPSLLLPGPRQPLRRRKHGGGLPSYRDARMRWQAVRYG